MPRRYLSGSQLTLTILYQNNTLVYAAHNLTDICSSSEIAYTSNESGINEIYVRSFPDVNNGRWKISFEGGDTPLWSPDGSELFYVSGDAAMAVAVTTGVSFSFVGTPRILFRGAYAKARSADSSWDIHPDGKRFLMIKRPGFTLSGGMEPRKISFVANWFQELKQRVPKN